jgi:single-stranded-DNA-specific exonuclease
VFPAVRIAYTKPVGDGHLKLSFTDGGPVTIDAICFNAQQSGLGPALEAHGGRQAHLAGRVEINHWQGRQRVQLRLEDAAWA